MNQSIKGRIGLTADIAIIVLAILGGISLIRGHLLNSPAAVKSPDIRVARNVPPPGKKIELSGVDWAQNSRTLLFVLSTQCHFCSESAPFYQKIVDKASNYKDVKLVAVFPQGTNQGEEYLKKYGIGIGQVYKGSMTSLGARGTPTLIMVDGNGIVKRSWVGLLSTQEEMDIMSWLEKSNNQA
jgi:hypothetical protein